MTHEESRLQTRQAFADALKQRMLRQPFSQITVSALVRDCGVNRKTFYYHFTDVYDLLNWMIQQDTLSVLSQFHLIREHDKAIAFVLDYIEENEVILLNIYRSVGRDILYHYFHDEFIRIAQQVVCEAEELQNKHFPEEFKRFLCELLTEAVCGILFSSLNDPSLRDRTHITEYVTVILRCAINGTLDVMDVEAEEIECKCTV